MARLNAGDPSWVLRFDRPDVELTFPGDNSWSGVYRGRAAVREWLERFVRVGLQIFADEIVVIGPPWRSTVCVRGYDYLDSPEGERVYENRYVIWGELCWGRLRRYEVYEDTRRSGALDDWLAVHEQRLTAA
jgi:ketosteroid isomerase-like protein